MGDIMLSRRSDCRAAWADGWAVVADETGAWSELRLVPGIGWALLPETDRLSMPPWVRAELLDALGIPSEGYPHVCLCVEVP